MSHCMHVAISRRCQIRCRQWGCAARVEHEPEHARSTAPVRTTGTWQRRSMGRPDLFLFDSLRAVVEWKRGRRIACPACLVRLGCRACATTLCLTASAGARKAAWLSQSGQQGGKTGEEGVGAFPKAARARRQVPVHGSLSVIGASANPKYKMQSEECIALSFFLLRDSAGLPPLRPGCDGGRWRAGKHRKRPSAEN